MVPIRYIMGMRGYIQSIVLHYDTPVAVGQVSRRYDITMSAVSQMDKVFDKIQTK